MALDFLALGELMCAICEKRPGADAGLRGLARLSAREWDVLLLAVDGEEVKQMERLLVLSESSVKHYLANAFSKAGDGSRALALARYVEWRTLLGLSGRS
jgi:DNA-binding NarL/FixJ family response regulator